MTTKIHDSDTCTAGSNGQPCEMCRFAQNARQTVSGLFRAERGEKIDSSPSSGSGTAISALDFDHEWNSAPARHRRYSYQEDALYWFVRGVRCGQLGQMVEENRVFRAMAAQRGLVLDGIEREK